MCLTQAKNPPTLNCQAELPTRHPEDKQSKANCDDSQSPADSAAEVRDTRPRPGNSYLDFFPVTLNLRERGVDTGGKRLDLPGILIDVPARANLN